MTTAGSTMVEVLVALLLTAVAAGALAAVATAGGRALVAARHDATATALAAARLEDLRAGPRTSGTDVIAHEGTTHARRWTATNGRGRPSALDVTVEWPGHAVALATEVAP